MKYIFLIIILIVYSCSGPNIGLDELPIVHGGFEHKQDKSQYQNKIHLNKDKIHDYFISQKPDIENVFGLAKFQIAEMDSSTLRPFHLYLLESTIKSKSTWHLITIDKKNRNIIDKYDFDPNSLELRLVYQHSSNLDHDGIAIELIEDNSKQDSIIIYNHYLEVFETGMIRFISKSDANSEVFKILTANQAKTGSYSFTEDLVNINLSLKDGLTADNYSYKLNISTPEGCIHSYMHLDCESTNNTIELDTIGNFKLIINDETIHIKNTNFESACEDIFKLNYELKKTDDNNR